MTTVEITTTEAEARRLTTRIKLVFGSMLDQHDKLVELVQEAKATSAHVALGYASWTAYVAAEFGELQVRLGRDDRRALVGALTTAGMPSRAIGEVVGVDHSTVVRDQQSGGACAPPVERAVTGRDGKTYTANAEPRKVRRSPLPDSYRRATWELRKSIERLERLHADDRFQTNRKDLADNGGVNVMVECSMSLTELGRHPSGADHQLGEYRPRGRGDYFGDD